MYFCLQLLKDDLFFDWTRGFANRGWPLMPAFNNFIMSCIESGIFFHWEDEASAKYLDRKTQQRLHIMNSGHYEKQPPSALTLPEISGALCALAIGLIVALFVLLLELFMKHIWQRVIIFK